jgi:uncharacterized protein (DUF2249 family)
LTCVKVRNNQNCYVPVNDGLMTTTILRLDVRDDIRAGGNPFAKIMKAVDDLASDEALVVIAPFEPLPLISLLETRGFSHSSNRTPSGDWKVTFTHGTTHTGAVERVHSSPASAEVPKSGGQQEINIDARGLEPPQPMVRILEALANLPDGSVLNARTDRRPMHLYAQLEARGFKCETQEGGDGSYITRIERS